MRGATRKKRHNPPLERTAAAVYFTCGRASRGRRRGRSTALRYPAESDGHSDAETSRSDPCQSPQVTAEAQDVCRDEATLIATSEDAGTPSRLLFSSRKRVHRGITIY